MASNDMREKAQALIAQLGLDPLVGNVGAGSDRLYVYLYGRWTGPRPTEFQGTPVEWHAMSGRPKALALA